MGDEEEKYSREDEDGQAEEVVGCCECVCVCVRIFLFLYALYMMTDKVEEVMMTRREV